jgi:hypothetical protein
MVTREEIEKIKGMACAAGDPSHLIVPLLALLEALNVCLRLLTERDEALKWKEAYREVAIDRTMRSEHYAVKLDRFRENNVNEKEIPKRVDAEAKRIFDETIRPL